MLVMIAMGANGPGVLSLNPMIQACGEKCSLKGEPERLIPLYLAKHGNGESKAMDPRTRQVKHSIGRQRIMKGLRPV